MPYFQLGDRQIPVGQGESAIGPEAGAVVLLPGGDSRARAVVVVSAGQPAVIRRGAPDAEVQVNGVALGVEPTPLLHGDRVTLGGVELRYGDDEKGGSTQFVSSAQVAELVQSSVGRSRPTTATGGRLVSLVDGREYGIPDGGVTFGREVGNDIVVAATEVSRKHAGIAPDGTGYVLTDYSTNGVFVNGTRIEQRHVLGRGDVVRIGPEEFRFYADIAKPIPPAPPKVVPAEVPPASLAVTERSAPKVEAPAAPPAPESSAAAVAAEPPTAPARAPLATLEVLNEGPMKGRTHAVHSALTNVGRGAHNDLQLQDESVSDSHAKLQKRADGWWLVDQGSTNGTYVGGRRVTGEVRLEGAPDVRFGGIKMAFRPAAVPADAGGGTRAIAAVSVDTARRAAAPVASAAAGAVAETKKKGCASVIAFAMALAGAGSLFLLVPMVMR